MPFSPPPPASLRWPGRGEGDRRRNRRMDNNATRQDRQKTTGPAWLPGDPDTAARVRRTIRVDHAGEYGAVRIYQGQIDMLGHTASGAAIRHMAQQEARHLRTFEDILARRRVRPTALAPLWHAAGYALGAATALMGDKAAMACTVAVEEEIGRASCRARVCQYV